MKKIYVHYSVYVIVMIMFIMALVSYQHLADKIPLQFSYNGEVNTWGPKYTIFLLPLISLGVIFLAEVTPRIDPKGKNYRFFVKSYSSIFLIIILVLFSVEILLISYSIGRPIENISQFVILCLGLFIMFMGNVLPKFKHNYFCGIRTAWTIANGDNWYLTHRFAAKVWVLCGLAVALLSFVQADYVVYLILGIIALLIIIPVGYSYLCFVKQKEEAND